MLENRVKGMLDDHPEIKLNRLRRYGAVWAPADALSLPGRMPIQNPPVPARMDDLDSSDMGPLDPNWMEGNRNN